MQTLDGLNLDSNQEPSCSEATVLTTTPHAVPWLIGDKHQCSTQQGKQMLYSSQQSSIIKILTKQQVKIPGEFTCFNCLDTTKPLAS